MSDLIILNGVGDNIKPVQTTKVVTNIEVDDCCPDEEGNSIVIPPIFSTRHNQLQDIQGGSSTERYHLIARLYDALQVSNATIDNKFATIEDLGSVTLDLEAKTLVTPSLSNSWLLFQNNGTTPYILPNSSSKSITVDKGVIARLTSTYQYPNPSLTEGLPIGVTGSFASIALPDPATPSLPLILNSITSNTTVNVILNKPKTGLIVVNGQVQYPTGNDTTSDSSSITFASRSYLGYSSGTTLTPTQILALPNNVLTNSRARTISGVTAGVGVYTYIVYDASLGGLSNIVIDNADAILGAFTRLADVTVTSLGGISVVMAVYRSNSTQAFTNNTLALS